MSTGYQNDLVYKKQIELLYRQIPLVLVAVIIISTITAATFYTSDNYKITLLWIASIYIVTSLRFYFYLLWSRSSSKIGLTSWAHIAVNFSLISGIQWAIATLIFFNNDSSISIAILTVILLGMISGAIGSLSVIPAAFAAFTAPITLFYIFAIIHSGNTDLYVFTYMFIVFIIAAGFFCRNTYKSNMHGIRLSIENMALIDNLQIEKEKAESANIAKSKFLAAASHDLRQPLQSMTLFTEALKENLTEEENLLLANRITNSHDALRELLNALLDISKLDADGIKIQNAAFDIATITNEIYLEFQPLATQKNQQLAISKSSYMVFSDPIITKRILKNLVANAIHHCPDESMIIIETTKQGNLLVVNVKDNGPGISAEEQNNIFNEFYQLKNPERDRNKGLGLGLAIVKRLSILLGNKIQLESSTDSGSNFSFEIPIATSEQLAKKEHVITTPNITSLDSMEILLVEDEIDVREALAVILKRWGCTVWQTDNIAGALAFIHQQNINFIITDYRLREHETGIALLEQVNEINPNIAGIMITGDTGTEQIQSFLKAGHIVLHKPVKPAELRMAIQQSVNKP